ncbi:autophagy- protein 2 [Lambiella insularis]|nr:autophagy- protein 2 [Lambiella insularis]
MGFFLPSFFQKRILRYALSRFNLLDTDALDLDKLDIVWGKRSTFELRDVGLRLKQLTSILRLPDYLTVTKAKVSLLRVTIPADIYRSGILVEVEGVKGQLCLNTGPYETLNPDATFHQRGGLPMEEKKNGPQTIHSTVHDPTLVPGTPIESNKDVDSGPFPTTVDLAQSFLQTEPLPEKAKLQAAVTESLSLQQSGLGEEAHEEFEPGLGVGLSLPGFIADFLKGIGDRLRLEVRKIQLDVDLNIEVPSSGSNTGSYHANSELLTVRIAIDVVKIDEVALNGNPSKNDDVASNQEGALETSGVREFSLLNVQIMLLSDVMLFTFVSQSAGVSSPIATSSSQNHKDVHKHSRKDHDSKSQSSSSSVAPSLARSTILDDVLAPAAALASTTAGEQSLDDGAGSSLQEPEDPDSSLHGSQLYRSRLEDSRSHGSSSSSFSQRQTFRSRDLSESQTLPVDVNEISLYEEDYNSETLGLPSHGPIFSSHENQQINEPPPQGDRGVFDSEQYFSDDFASDEDPVIPQARASHPLDATRKQLPTNKQETFSGSTSPESDDTFLPAQSAPNSDEDLTQSRIFSSAEAKSMYMSAISHVSNAEDPESPEDPERREVKIPGAWDATSSDVHQQYGLKKDENSVATSTGKNLLILQRPRPSSTLIENGSLGKPEGKENLSDIQQGLLDFQHTPVEPCNFAGLPPPLPQTSSEDGVSQKSENSSAALKSPARMMKRFAVIDTLVLSLPQYVPDVGPRGHKASDLDSNFPQERHAFSTKPSIGLKSDPKPMPTKTQNEKEFAKFESDLNTLRASIISVNHASLLVDTGLTRLMIMILQQMLAIQLKTSATTSAEFQERESLSRSLILKFEKFSFNFVDVTPGHLVDSAQAIDTAATSPSASASSEAFLTATLENLGLNHRSTGLSSRTELSLGKFEFGYPADHILSFASGLRMRTSNRDILAPVNKDIEISIIRNAGSLRIDATTLPIHVTLDLARLDETFSWFGGLSTVLGLGSSMISTVTVVESKTKAPSKSKGTRGVRFNTSENIERHNPVTDYKQKVTIRVGGLLFDLHSKSSSLRIESSAIKLVSREEGVGVQLDKLKFNGPYPRQSEAMPAVTMQLGNIRIEYLPVPKEVDLARLLALLSPSRDRDEQDDDILLDTLFRQRRQGAVIRFTMGRIDGNITSLNDLAQFSTMFEELAKLSTVAKYLPEDDRPGILSLILIRELNVDIKVSATFGSANVVSRGIESAHVTLPYLTLIGINSLRVSRQGQEVIGEVLLGETIREQQSPMIMARLIGDEMEPTIKFKLWNLRIEYHISTVMATLGLSETATGDMIITDLAGSIATLTDQQLPPKLASQPSESNEKSSLRKKTLRFEVAIRDSVVGLNPRTSQSKGLFVLSNTRILGTVPGKDVDELSGIMDIKKAVLMVIDSTANIVTESDLPTVSTPLSPRTQVQSLAAMGFVAVSDISAAKIMWQAVPIDAGGERSIDVDVRDDLFVLETCADSTQTLLAVFNGLQPPVPPSQEVKYRTEVIPVEDMLASFTGNTYITTEDEEGQRNDYPLELDESDLMEDDVPQNIEFVSSFYNPTPAALEDGIANKTSENDLGSSVDPPLTRQRGDKRLFQSFQEECEVATGFETLDFNEEHFGSQSQIGGTAHKWNSDQNTYNSATEYKIRGSPLRLRVRDVHIIWNLFDGYDWQKTRNAISQAVTDVESKAAERLARKDKRRSQDPDGEEESVIGDFLFNSIYIGIPANHDPRDLSRQVNRNINDMISEAESYATTTTATGSPNRQGRMPRTERNRHLRLQRSKHHKMTFELKGVAIDLVIFPPASGETLNSIDIRVHDLEIFDHIPTSTWKKFATYMHDAGERQSGASMIHIEILNVRPVPELAASEIILKATVLPLRLHVDQDALDFLTRFFEFKDDTTPIHTSKSDVPFLQRVEVNSVQVKLDFKPKRVDYAGLRSGHTTEFMNFFILDQANMVLRHVIIYGVSGFDKLGKTLNDIWMPDIKRNQLPGVLAGLAPVRSLVNVGGGVKDLVVIPMREYRKDGRVMRSIQKGAFSFAKTTTTELAKLGAKLALGTQTVLQGAEDYLVQASVPQGIDNWESADLDEDEKKHISLYADQPAGVMQGLRGAYRHLERDLVMAKDAIIAMPGEVMESGTAGGAARAVLRSAPTVILRPALGVTKAVGQTLLGATNSLDKGERRRIEEKYKRH